jgi:hypothetical protein
MVSFNKLALVWEEEESGGRLEAAGRGLKASAGGGVRRRTWMHVARVNGANVAKTKSVASWNVTVPREPGPGDSCQVSNRADLGRERPFDTVAWTCGKLSCWPQDEVQERDRSGCGVAVLLCCSVAGCGGAALQVSQ